MYVVAYYIVFAMINESTMVNLAKKNQKLYYCFTSQCMIELSDRHVLRLMCIDINMYNIYF